MRTARSLTLSRSIGGGRVCKTPRMQTPWMQAPSLPPWTKGMTHACENITFPQLLLRTVKIEDFRF